MSIVYLGRTFQIMEIAHGKALNMSGYLRNSKEARMAGVVQAKRKQ